jgi:hypothetical protein
MVRRDKKHAVARCRDKRLFAGTYFDVSLALFFFTWWKATIHSPGTGATIDNFCIN